MTFELIAFHVIISYRSKIKRLHNLPAVVTVLSVEGQFSGANPRDRNSFFITAHGNSVILIL